MKPEWLEWARRLQAIAQSGLAYEPNPYDRERYEEVRKIAAEIMAHGSGGEPAAFCELFAGQVGYATPKVDVRGAVFRGDRILLVKEREDGGWTLPGGWADVGESAAEATVREVREESGYETRAVKLLAVYDRNRHGHPPIPFHAYKLFFLCELVDGGRVSAKGRGSRAAIQRETPLMMSGASRPVLRESFQSHETAGAGWFREDELPPLSTSRVTGAQIRRFFEHHRNPQWPADFD